MQEEGRWPSIVSQDVDLSLQPSYHANTIPHPAEKLSACQTN